jgi:hypothetical protein
VVGDAFDAVGEVGAALGDWKADGARIKRAKSLFAE